MSENIRYALMFVAVVFVAIGMVALIVISTTVLPQPQVRRIDCTWSEISPDFTPAMREACRKARNERSN
jgi:hypothetical protein